MFKITLQPNLIYPLVIAFVGNEQRKQNRTQVFPAIPIAFTCCCTGCSQHTVNSPAASGDAQPGVKSLNTGTPRCVLTSCTLPQVPAHGCHLLKASPWVQLPNRHLCHHSALPHHPHPSFLQYQSLCFTCWS